MAVFDLKDQVCVVGVGTSEKFAFALPEKSPISLGIESLRAALEDAGLKREDIDGFQTSHGGPGYTRQRISKPKGRNDVSIS